ncbi:protein CBG06246 family [Trichomonas vaginalis G3]|uniref:protein CBG06246 family n=1 Tax=Trichomonas vaginalis (strain ATCC PRA-98 / G3) TaxID=412133 RepID=UPI0021E55471|nr:protein CBG06246 family [Trichomonas vaginalis G3]KAI5509869.1 protein CBG06246 family [Trichomonas vaginalis G3]
MDKIRSCLKSNEDVISFFDKVVYPKFMETYQGEMAPCPAKVILDFMDYIVPTFFGKLVGNPIQFKVESSELFASKSEFLISRTMPDEMRKDCLSVLRTVMDFSFSEQIEDRYGVNQEFLTRKAKQYLWGSRKLLQDQAIEQIPEFAEHLRTGVKSYDFENLEIEFCDNYKATVEPKVNGVEFGEILSLKKGEETVVRYFIKAFSGYPIKNHRQGSKDIWSSEMISDCDDDPFPPFHYRHPNLRDPFVYKILESLGVGPHVEIIINPYISCGFYIATRDLTYGNQTFIELGSTKTRADLDWFMKNQLLLFPNQYGHIKENLTTLDVIERILCLADLHKHNVGLLLMGSDKYRLVDFVNNVPILNPQIIDFKVYRMKEWQREYLGRQFRDGDNHGEYKEPCIIPKLIQFRPHEEKFYMGFKAIKNIQEILGKLIPIENPHDSQDVDEIQLKELLKQKFSEIKTLLLQRRDDLPVLGNRTNAELIGYKFKICEEDQKKEGKYRKYVEDSLEDLDDYCKDVIINYHILKNYILDKYHEYYDEDGKLKKQNT